MERSDVFLSYRRADVEFTKKLFQHIKDTGREIWVDWEDIQPGVEGFTDEIQRGIEGADAFICVLSPNYLESEYCLMELREALKLKKRVIPVIHKKFEPMPAPEGIGHINWVYFTPHAGQKNKFEEAFPRVVQALEADYEHTREHTRLLLRAIDWDKNQQNRSYLLKDAEIDKAEHWQVSAINKVPTPTEMQGKYILTSRANQRQQQRRFTAIIGILLGFALLAAVFAGFQWNSALLSKETAVAERNRAQAQKATAISAESTAVVAKEEAVFAQQEAENQRAIAETEAQNALISSLAAQSQLIQKRQLGILVALESYNASVQKGELNPAVETSLRSSLAGFSGVPVNIYQSTAMFVQFSPDNRWLISSADNGEVQVSHLAEGLNFAPIILTESHSKRKFTVDFNNLPQVIVSPDSQWLAGIYFDEDTGENGVWIWSLNDLDAGPEILELPESAGLPVKLAFSSLASKQYWLAVGLDDGSIYTWDASNLEQAQASLFYKDKFRRSVPDLLFSRDGLWMVGVFLPTASYDAGDATAGPMMLVWNIKNQVSEPILVDLLGTTIANLTFSDSGKWLAGFSNIRFDNSLKLRVWNMSTLTETNTGANSLDAETGGQIAFSPDDRWIAAAGWQNVEIWSTRGFSKIKLPGYKDQVFTVNFSPDSHWLATGDWDGQVRLWNTTDFAKPPVTESQAQTYRSFDTSVRALDFNSNGSQFAAAGDQQVRVWDSPLALSDPFKVPANGAVQVIKDFVIHQNDERSLDVMDVGRDEPAVVLQTTHENPIGYFMSTDNRYLAVISAKQLQVWDLQNPGQPLFESERTDGQFTSPIFTADSHWFTFAVYNQIFALDLQKSGEPILLSGNRAGIPIQFLTSARNWLIAQSSLEVVAWDTASGLDEPVKLADLSASSFTQFVAPDSSMLVIQQSESFSVRDLSDVSGDPVLINGGFSEAVHDRWVLSSTDEGETALWDLTRPDEVIVQTIGSYGFSSVPNWFFYYDEEFNLWLIDLRNANPKPVAVGKFESGQSPIFSPSDHWFAMPSDDGSAALVHDLTSDLAKVEVADATPFGFTADERWLILSDLDQDTRLYDLQARSLLPVKYPAGSGLEQFSSDRRWAIGALTSNAFADTLLVDLSQPEKYYVLSGHTDVLLGRLFTPDGHSLLTYGWDGTIRVWNLEDPGSDPVVLSHENAVADVQLSENGRWLVSSTNQNTYLWRWNFAEVHDLACRLVGRNLTLDEWAKYIGAAEYRKTCEQWP